METTKQILYSDGRTETFETEKEIPTLKEMQEAVDGLIQIIPTKQRNKFLVIDEEGKCKKKPINIEATHLYGNPNDVVVGDVIYISNSLLR